jgi:Na+/H+ antiporter NhaD/arsenite permease-like protein
MTLAAPAIPRDLAASDKENAAVVPLPGGYFVLACVLAGALVLLAGRFVALPAWLLATEVLATILGLFVFGSFKYQIHKNALTYGMAIVIVATFCGLSTSPWHIEVARHGWLVWVQQHLLSFSGLDELVHADTMLFIFGLTLFVAVIAQTRLLESLTFVLLRRSQGAILPTILSVTAVVAVASGFFDGVSMIGLTIRTLLIVMLLSGTGTAEARYAVMVCTMVTTICGVWLAYGEPPNLIMRANLFPHLDDLFFLRYCAPAAVASYLVVGWQLRRRIRGPRIDLDEMDVIDANAADVRFLQAMRHGEVLTTIQLVHDHAGQLDRHTEPMLAGLRHGESLGLALVREGVPEPLRIQLLGHFVSEDLAESLDRHYLLDAAGDREGAIGAERAVDKTLATLALLRRDAQRLGGLAVVPFGLVLALHGVNHRVPLFLSSFAGFLAALPAIATVPRVRALAFREARHELGEYLFLFPLFLSITLLSTSGFFGSIQDLIRNGITTMGSAHVAVAQFLGATVLSAILDNNIVADFASRALLDVDLAYLHLFALAQIVGYAVGGCWTHIGSAQSVVAFAFIRREVDEHYTPVQWIKEMTPVIVQVIAVLTGLIYVESAIFAWFG